MAPPPPRSLLRAPLAFAALLAAAAVILVVVALGTGPADAPDGAAAIARALAGALGLGPGLEDATAQALFELRLWRPLVALLVGASLALSGALVQGLFQNPLASPSVLGITQGASLGAVVALLLLGSSAATPALASAASRHAPLLVPLCAFAGAIAVGALVWRLASSTGQVSIPTLLLFGIAANTFLGGIVELVQLLVLDRMQISRSILAWSMGTLSDREAWHAAVAAVAFAVSLAAAPFVAWELDLFQGGIEDAEAQGVDTLRVRWTALAAASLAAAAAVAVAGQIAFVGLIVPHLVRLWVGGSYRRLLYLAPLAGAVFLLATDVAQRILLDDRLRPGVAMSLVGGPFFVWLVWTRRRELASF